MTHDPSRSPSQVYEALAAVYDEWQGAEEGTPFADVVLDKLEPDLARFSGAPVGSFVDFGCGTGTLLHHLRRRHPAWRLGGVDASAAMLAVAQAKPGAQSIEWVNAGLGERLDEGVDNGVDNRLAAPAFDAAGCFYDTLNHLRDTADLARALNAIAASLRPGGLLVFDVTNEQGFEGWWRGRRTWRGAGWRVAVEMAYDPTRREGAASVTVDRGAAETKSAILIERCFTADEWQAALAGAGLELVAASRWNPFPDDAPGKTWVISRKKLP